MPKTKTEMVWNAETKRYEEKPRLIHVHVVIPTTNLLTRKRAAPFEMMERTFGTKDSVNDFADAFKESINQKYALTSPNSPAHRRDGFGGKADIISRIKGDNFADRKAKNHATLKELRNKIFDEKIESEAAFKTMLQNMGFEIRTANRGKPDQYLKIRKFNSRD
jgi:hypothetical protein